MKDFHLYKDAFVKASLGNGDKYISTIVFGVRYHPDNSSILKTFLTRISSDDKNPSSKKIIHFVPYGLI